MLSSPMKIIKVFDIKKVIPRNSEAFAGTLEPCYNISMSKIGN